MNQITHTATCPARRPLVAPRHASLLFSVLMVASMTLILSLSLTALNSGLAHDFATRWLRAYVMAFAIAMPAFLGLRPRVQAVVNWLTRGR